MTHAQYRHHMKTQSILFYPRLNLRPNQRTQHMEDTALFPYIHYKQRNHYEMVQFLSHPAYSR